MTHEEVKKKYTITLDDDPLVHKIISQITGIASLPFSGASKLLERAKSFNPLALFIDVHLGLHVSGLDLIVPIRQAWPYVPILVVTDNPSSELVGNALALGANDFVRKPFIAEELTGRLHARISEMNTLLKSDIVTVYDVAFNRSIRSIHCGDKTVYLPDLEARLFDILASNNGIEVSKDVLRGQLWGNLALSNNSLDKKFSSLRGYLNQAGSSIKIYSRYRGGVRIIIEPTPE